MRGGGGSSRAGTGAELGGGARGMGTNAHWRYGKRGARVVALSSLGLGLHAAHPVSIVVHGDGPPRFPALSRSVGPVWQRSIL